MGQSRIIRYKDVNLINRGEGVMDSEIVGGSTGATQLSSGIVTYPPGTTVPLHLHNAEESAIIIEGEATCELEGETYHLTPYDGVFIVPGGKHHFINKGDRPLIIVWTYATIHVARTYVEQQEA